MDEIMQPNIHIRFHVIIAVVSVVVGRPADFLEGSIRASRFSKPHVTTGAPQELACDMET
jgi:hypothetical protein